MNFNNEGSVLLKDSAASLKGDTVESLVNGDAIDITNLAFNGTTTESFTPSGADTMMTVQTGPASTSVMLFGQYAAGDFSVGADSSGHGTLITVTHQLLLAAPH